MKARSRKESVILPLIIMLVVPIFICVVQMPRVEGATVADQYEPDDDHTQAKVIRNSQPQNHSIYPVGDQDCLEIRIDFESDVVIETYGSSGDTEMWLYGLALNQLAYDDNGGQGLFSKVSAHLNAGIYYVKIGEKGNDAAISEYYVRVTYAQAFQSTYGGDNDDRASSVQQTSDGGYIIAGYTSSGSRKVYIAKTDVSGNMQWQKTYDYAAHSIGGDSVQETSDGGYIIAGYIYDEPVDEDVEEDVYLVKTDSSGNMLWQKTYGGSSWDLGSSVQQTSDGGYIIAGMTMSFGSGGSDVYLVKTDSNGTMQWSRTYGGPNLDGGYSVQETSDGGYIIAGYTYSYSIWDFDVYLVKTDSNGNLQWSRTYGGAQSEWGYFVQQTSDGGYIIAGMTFSFGSGGSDVYLVKTDSSGTMQWSRTYGGPSEEEGLSARQTSDGGFIIAGHTNSFGSGSSDVYLVKTDSNGNLQWSRTYGGPNSDGGCSVQQTSDGGYIITGYTETSSGSGNYDVYLVKTGQNGYSPPCRDEILEEGTTLIPTVVYTILHDPPGDESYSYFRQTKSTSIETTLFGGGECTIGFEGKASFLGSGVDASTQVSFSLSDTKSDTLVTSYTVGYTSGQISDDPWYIGPGYGDSYFGEAWLLHYRIVKRTYPNGTTAKVMEYGATRECSQMLGSKFLVSATWIKDHVPEPWRSKLFALNPAHDNFISAEEEGSVTHLDSILMSGGIPYSYDYTVTGRSTSSFTFEVEMSYEVAWQCGFEILGIGASGKAKVGLTFNFGITQETSEERKTEIGYELYDNDGDDTLSVDIYYDKVYGTYMFIAKQGTDTTNPVEPYEHKIAVTNITSSKTIVGQGYSTNINVTAANQGLYTETFNVTLYANATVIGTRTNITLTSRSSTTITFTWSTTGFVKGNYTISAYATPVPNETDTVDNRLTDGWVIVACLGDLTSETHSGVPDGKVDENDLWYFCAAYIDYYKIPSRLDANCDFDNNNKIDEDDLWTFCSAFIDY